MDEEINIEEFKIRWKDFLASNLYGDLTKEIRSLLTHIIKELENHIMDKAKKIVDLENKVKKLEKGIEKVLKWRGLDGDGISDPLRKELYELVGRDEK